jgi:hypothetical protein
MESEGSVVEVDDGSGRVGHVGRDDLELAQHHRARRHRSRRRRSGGSGGDDLISLGTLPSDAREVPEEEEEDPDLVKIDREKPLLDAEL